MKRLLVLVALAGCDRWETCQERADWYLDFALQPQITPGFEGDFVSEAQQAAGVMVRAHDGSSILVINDAGSDVKFGDLRIRGTAIARIGANGELLGLAPAPDIPNGMMVVRSDAAGNVVIAQFSGTLQLYALDAGLHRRWTQSIQASGIGQNVAAGGDGLVAYAARGSSTDILHYLEPDGSERWSLPLPALAAAVWLDEAADVHVYTSGTSGFQHVHYASDGTYVSSQQIEATPTAFGRDGSYVVALGGQFTEDPINVSRYTVDGMRLWRRSVGQSGFINVAVADNGDVLVPTNSSDGSTLSARMLRLSAKSGDTRDDVISCSQMQVVGGDSDHYIGIGQVGAIPSVGIAGFSF
jgi:hypothetical protein